MSGRCSLAKAALELLAPDFTPMEAAAKITQAIHDDDRFPLYCNGEPVKANIRAIAKVVPELKDDGRWTVDIESTGSRLGWEPGAYNWELEVDAVLALKPEPDTRAEAPQATAISAMHVAEAATADAKAAQAKAEGAQAEIEQARAEARADLERARTEMQAAIERMDMAEARAEAAEARVKAMVSEPPSEIDRILETSPRPRGGAPRKYQWHDINAEIARRCHDPKTGLVKLTKSERKLARELLEWCHTTYNEEPAESVMREAVAAMYAALRPLQR